MPPYLKSRGKESFPMKDAQARRQTGGGSVLPADAVAPAPTRMKKYRDWPFYPRFRNDCAEAAAGDVLVTPPVAAAILGYSKVRIRRILDQEDILSWAWYEADQFHASEVFVSVRSLVRFGLKKGRLGKYEDETPLRAVLDRDAYEQLRQASGI